MSYGQTTEHECIVCGDIHEPGHVADLQAQLSEAWRILKLMEWTEGSYGQYCLVCDGYHPNHAPDCALAHAIR